MKKKLKLIILLLTLNTYLYAQVSVAFSERVYDTLYTTKHIILSHKFLNTSEKWDSIMIQEKYWYGAEFIRDANSSCSCFFCPLIFMVSQPPIFFKYNANQYCINEESSKLPGDTLIELQVPLVRCVDKVWNIALYGDNLVEDGCDYLAKNSVIRTDTSCLSDLDYSSYSYYADYSDAFDNARLLAMKLRCKGYDYSPSKERAKYYLTKDVLKALHRFNLDNHIVASNPINEQCLRLLGIGWKQSQK